MYFSICITDVRFRFVSHTPSKGANHDRRTVVSPAHRGAACMGTQQCDVDDAEGVFILKIPDPLIKMNNVIIYMYYTFRRQTLSEM